VSPSPLARGIASPAELREQILAGRCGSPFLVYRDGDDRQVIVELHDELRRLTIGRRASNDIVLSWDAEVSRLHAEIERVGASWVVSDDGLSHNGTLVNGEHLDGRRRLHDGDVLAIGGTLIAYCTAGEASTMSAATKTGVQAGVAVSLTPAQRRVLMALCRPYRDGSYAAPPSNQQIADELFLTVHTVKGTLRQLFDVFEIRGVSQNQKRAQLATRALQTGVIRRRDL
jgi:pSer/pThr/pTyr-binding forkhead associated (FHA) protein